MAGYSQRAKTQIRSGIWIQHWDGAGPVKTSIHTFMRGEMAGSTLTATPRFQTENFMISPRNHGSNHNHQLINLLIVQTPATSSKISSF